MGTNTHKDHKKSISKKYITMAIMRGMLSTLLHTYIISRHTKLDIIYHNYRPAR